MSCSAVAVPFALAKIVILLTGAAMEEYNRQKEKANAAEIKKYANYLQEGLEKEVQHIQAKDIIEKEYETAFMDKDILLKTLEEHGVTEIEEEYEGKIFGKIDNFGLNFEKPSSDKPYILKIYCLESDNADEKLDDLNAEYALNVQEEAYLDLIERLKENNMEIENEVVEDDNTIVLTINLE